MLAGAKKMSEFVELSQDDITWVVKCIPLDLRVQMIARPNKAIVAGGFLRACIAGEQKSDIDIFVPSVEDAKALVDDLQSNESRAVIVTENATTLYGIGLPLQVIHKWTFETAHAVLESFDFTIARSGVWFDGITWRGLADGRFYSDLAAKRLRYTQNGVPGGSILRVLKFVARGYRIPPYEFASLVDALCTQAGTSPGLENLREIMNDVDPATVMDDLTPRQDAPAFDPSVPFL